MKAEETEHLRTLGPKHTIKEGQQLNDYIDGPLAKTCDANKQSNWIPGHCRNCGARDDTQESRVVWLIQEQSLTR